MADLCDALRTLRVSIGKPSFNTLAGASRRKQAEHPGDDIALSTSSMSEQLRATNPKPLTYSFVRRFAIACDATAEEVAVFQAAWRRITASSDRPAGPPGVPGQREAGTSAPDPVEDHLATLARMTTIADGITAEAELPAARDLYQHVHDVYDRLLIRDERWERLNHDLGIVLSQLGRLDAAHELLRRTLSDFTARYGGADPATLSVLDELAIVQLQRRQFADAANLARQCQDSRRALRSGPADPAFAETTEILAEALLQTGDTEEAERALAELDRTERPAEPPGSRRFWRFRR
jgi:tetratricopeptide (TPR) repeat protein